MSMRNLIMSVAGNTGVEKLYVDDVFSAYTYAGAGAAKNIPNGIDLLGQGGMTWIKCRDIAQSNYLYDTTRGVTKSLTSNDAAVQVTGATGLIAWNDQASGYGFQLGSGASTYVNSAGSKYASWTFRKAPKFFDVVTFTTEATGRAAVNHALGSMPGLVIAKKLSGTPENWHVWCNGISTSQELKLNTTDPANTGSQWVDVNSTTVTFVAYTVLAGSSQYVAYFFAHDPSADGMIQCGAFTTNGSGLATVNLGWEPQYVMVKATSATGDWEILDQSRSWCAGASNDAILMANTTSAESVTSRGEPNASGFVWQGALSTTYTYMAIRRPNKPPTVGTQVYKGLLHTATNNANTVKSGVGFAPDLLISQSRSQGRGSALQDRLRGATKQLLPTDVSVETTQTDTLTTFDQDGVTLGADGTAGQFNFGGTYIEHFFKRAPGVFDIVCYTGTGVIRTVAHGLGVVPELVIVKSRSAATTWLVGSTLLAVSEYLLLSTVSAKASAATLWNGAYPTASTLSIGTDAVVNTNSATYVAYLFATLAGVSKVGNYTGDGTNGKVINCGFSTGARFVMIKCTSAAGDWFVWDTTRGVVASTDPHLSLNTNAVEVTTDDSIDPDNSGFIVNQLAATNINVNAASYIFLAFS